MNEDTRKLCPTSVVRNERKKTNPSQNEIVDETVPCSAAQMVYYTQRSGEPPLDQCVMLSTYDESSLVRVDETKCAASDIGPNPANLGSITSTGIDGFSIAFAAFAESDSNTRDSIREAVDSAWQIDKDSYRELSAKRLREARQSASCSSEAGQGQSGAQDAERAARRHQPEPTLTTCLV